MSLEKTPFTDRELDALEHELWPTGVSRVYDAERLMATVRRLQEEVKFLRERNDALLFRAEVAEKAVKAAQAQMAIGPTA